MALVLGIDEAGYGPRLGPLVVGASLWRVRSECLDECFWKLLQDCVCRSPRTGDWRLGVDDSKEAFDRKRGLHTLERSVLAFAQAAGTRTETLCELLCDFGGASSTRSTAPWYRELELSLPLDRRHSQFRAVSKRLGRVMSECGAQCIALLVEVVPEDHFNSRVQSTRNKATILLEHILRILQRASVVAGDEPFHVYVDRLGGRINYRDLLTLAFPQRALQELAISPECSRYRLVAAASEWKIEFTVEADSRHLPVALASMTAKYIRELLMDRFNHYWRQWLPDLRPTAGYYGDAQRFLDDIAPVLAQSGVPLASFVRER